MKDIICEVSAKHVHLCKKDFELLFGAGAVLNAVKALSQTGEFLSDKRVEVIGQKGKLENVAVLGPLRENTQVELAYTDCFKVGINAPLRISGDTAGSASCVLASQNNKVQISEGVIVAKRHLHLEPETAKKLMLKSGDNVDCYFDGQRECVLKQVAVRVKESFTNALHLDTDEYNACGMPKAATKITKAK